MYLPKEAMIAFIGWGFQGERVEARLSLMFNASSTP